MKILIVEDEKALASSIARGLKQAGYAVEHVCDGEEGLYIIETQHEDIDVVILDITLPKMNGYDVCRMVRSKKIHTPILMLTARDAVEDKIQGLDCGADDYLVKPFKLDELLARIRALLRRPKTILHKEVCVKDLVINFQTRKIRKGVKEIDVTTKEFQILEYFIRNQGTIVSREQILSNIWPYDFDSFSNVVDVHINNLRKKLDDYFDEKIIETIRGSGYRIST